LQNRWTILKVLTWSADYLARKGVAEPRLEAEILLAWCLHCPRIGLYTSFDADVNEDTLARFRECLKRRAAREPSQYITAKAEFFSLPIRISPDVLIPRPETEVLVESVLALCAETAATAKPARIVDAGTGSGAVAVALATRLPHVSILATDRSARAVDVARANAQANNVAGAVSFAVGDYVEPVVESGWAGAVDVVVSNPPYISEADFAALQPEVRLFEPREALVAGPTGLEAFERLVPAAAEVLKTGGWLCVEVGAGQAEEVVQIFHAPGGFRNVSVRDDFSGIPRVVQGQR